MTYVERAGLLVAEELAAFVETDALNGLGIQAQAFWAGAEALFRRFTPANKALLETRSRLQREIDDWFVAQGADAVDPAAHEAFLRRIGYIEDEPASFEIETAGVDEEIAALAGPQLVVPVLNARFLLNAANARWGSLYDALYGADAIARTGDEARGYDARRGALVVARACAFLDEAFALAEGSHAKVTQYRVVEGRLSPALARPNAFVGYRGDPDAPEAVLLRRHGLHVELTINRTHPVGQVHLAGLADVVLEAALTTIVDLEDSVAAVDAADKVAAYANWLGLMRGDLSARFEKDGRAHVRALAPDRNYLDPEGRPFSLPGRSLLLVRNVGHLMTTPAVRMDGDDVFEGLLDALMTSLIGLHDLRGLGAFRNSRAGAVYIVKPKMHGPAEVAFANEVLNSVENILGMARDTIKIGVMDEERRTSMNLAACIAAVRTRIAFINTGFLDRTGDEIHTCTRAGAMVRKTDMRSTAWFDAYEKRNVAIGLGCGLSGRAQIGKGMWAAPDRMADMIEQKIAHPRAGASTAWVPSPTAATLHALHYHAVDVFSRQRELAAEPPPPLSALLSIPLADNPDWTEAEVTKELENNAQSILGYVVRWVDQGVGCSKVPDINDIGLMEDRATLRISSQHLANWLLHGVCTREQVEAAFQRMASKVDSQNVGDPFYRPMSRDLRGSLAYQAACALVFQGLAQPSGYTEPLLHQFRTRVKSTR